MKMWKVYDDNDNDEDNNDGQRTNFDWAFGSGELKTLQACVISSFIFNNSSLVFWGWIGVGLPLWR